MLIDCIIIDDEPLAIEKLQGFITKAPGLKLLQSFNNGIEALAFCQTNNVHLVFLDILMDSFTGIQFLESLYNKPKVIITSAYSQYAIHGFEHDVSDYLLKPFSFERFLKALDKVNNELMNAQQKISPKNYLFVKTEFRMERINFDEILYIEGMSDYLHIITANKKIMTLQSFAKLEGQLPETNFIRVHKSFMVAVDKIETIERNVIKICDKRIPIGASFRDLFYKKLNSK